MDQKKLKCFVCGSTSSICKKQINITDKILCVDCAATVSLLSQEYQAASPAPSEVSGVSFEEAQQYPSCEDHLKFCIFYCITCKEGDLCQDCRDQLHVGHSVERSEFLIASTKAQISGLLQTASKHSAAFNKLKDSADHLANRFKMAKDQALYQLETGIGEIIQKLNELKESLSDDIKEEFSLRTDGLQTLIQEIDQQLQSMKTIELQCMTALDDRSLDSFERLVVDQNNIADELDSIDTFNQLAGLKQQLTKTWKGLADFPQVKISPDLQMLNKMAILIKPSEEIVAPVEGAWDLDQKPYNVVYSNGDLTAESRKDA